MTTTTARIADSPALTAPTTALRSAQIVAPYEADSTLQPACSAPLSGQDRGTNLKARVRGMRVRLGTKGHLEQRGELGQTLGGGSPVDPLDPRIHGASSL